MRDHRLWQVGKVGMYLTMVAQIGQFRTFHEGPIWTAMDKAIGVMEKVTEPPTGT